MPDPQTPTVTKEVSLEGRTVQRPAEHETAGHSASGGPTVITAWMLSLSVHAACLTIMLLAVFPYAAADEAADLPLVNAQLIGDVHARPASPAARTSAVAESGFGALRQDGPRFTPSTAPASDALARISPSVGGPGPDLSILGIGSEGGFGGGDGGFGLTLDGGGGGGPEFFGVTATAPGVRSVVYVVDRSGSMVDTFHRVRAELKRSISALRRSQKFHVIFFNAAEPLESPPQRLVNAIDAHKQQFFGFLEAVSPGGGTKPERAMRRALALEPDILYFLSDGVFDPAVAQKLDEWNRERRTRIYTIAYLDQTGRQLLENIAREHGGEFRFVSEDDLP